MNRKPIGLSVPYRKTEKQESVEAKLAALQKKVTDLEQRVKQLEKNK